MGRVRVTNDSEETITIEPGETADLRGEENIIRVMASRVNTLNVNSHEDKSAKGD